MLLLILLSIFDLNPTYGLSLGRLLEDGKLVIIGETHRRPESAQLVIKTVTEYIQDGKCLMVGLEIPSHEQPILERALSNRVSISRIPLNGFIDHPGYRKMLASFRDQIRQGKCLKVRAIDKPDTVPMDRDEWMEKEVLGMMDGTPILVLVGNFHAMKEVKWNSEPLGGVGLAERLANRGIRFISMLQYWEKKRCDTRSEMLVSTEEPQSLEYVKEIMEAIHAKTPDKASSVADAVVVWSCVN